MNPVIARLCRLLTGLLLALVLASTLAQLAGCGGGGDDPPPDMPTPAVLCNTQPPVCT